MCVIKTVTGYIIDIRLKKAHKTKGNTINTNSKIIHIIISLLQVLEGGKKAMDATDTDKHGKLLSCY